MADAVRGADAAVIVTEWPELPELASAETHEADGEPTDHRRRNLLDPVAVRAAGFVYEGIGRPSNGSEALTMEAIMLCGGKAERLGDAAGGRPKSLVDIAGRPMAAYQVAGSRRPASTV